MTPGSRVSSAYINNQVDWLNAVRKKFRRKNPKVHVLFSRSCIVGRYDIIRRFPSSSVLKSCDNGRIIDTIRPSPVEEYLIDPRLPSGVIENPATLILGVSGDGITKTARASLTRSTAWRSTLKSWNSRWGHSSRSTGTGTRISTSRLLMAGPTWNATTAHMT